MICCSFGTVLFHPVQVDQLRSGQQEHKAESAAVTCGEALVEHAHVGQLAAKEAAAKEARSSLQEAAREYMHAVVCIYPLKIWVCCKARAGRNRGITAGAALLLPAC